MLCAVLATHAHSGVICTAWLAGMMSGRSLHPLFHMLAAVTVTGIFLLSATGRMNFPNPYDPTLSPSMGKVKELSDKGEGK